MTLRTRLSLAFVFVVLIPVLVGAVIVSLVAPHLLRDRVDDRTQAARVTVSNVLSARCTQAAQTAQLLGLEVAALGAQAAVDQLVANGSVDYAVVADTDGRVTASAGKLPGAPSAQPAPGELTSCADGAGASYALASRARLDIAASPSLSEVAVAWSIGASTAGSIQRGLFGAPALTLVAGSRVVSSTLDAPRASAQLDTIVAAHGRATVDVSGRVLAVAPASTGEPYGFAVSEPVPNTTSLTLLLAVVVVVAVLGALLIGSMLARLISRPVAELSDAAGRVAGGDLDTTLPVRSRSRDEVGRLAAAFNHMTVELRSYIGELQRSRDELRRNLDRLGATLTHTHDLFGILGVVLDTAMVSARAGGGAIFFLDADGYLSVKAARGTVADALPIDTRLAPGAGITGRVASSGEPVRGVVGDGPGLRADPVEPPAGTVIAVPLRQSGRVVGVLDLYDKEGDRGFGAHDLDTLMTFASQASVAIENVLLHQEAQRLSLTDPMTGLWNYRYLTLGLSHEIERATRFGRPLALLMIDLDRFKAVNDHHGHQVGDAVLIELASRLRAEVREVDTVARYGGEEFVVVLPETDGPGAVRTAERICDRIRSAPFCIDAGLDLAVTASIGVAVFPEHGSTPSWLLHSADDALYAAKDGGRNRWGLATTGVIAAGDPAGQADADDAQPPQPSALPNATPEQPAEQIVVVPDVSLAPWGRSDRRT